MSHLHRGSVPAHLAAWISLLGCLLSFQGCGGAAGGGLDASVEDAALPDVVVVDAPVSDDASSSLPDAMPDATPDAMPDASTDGGLCPPDPPCDPVTGLGCGSASWCVLQGASPRCVVQAGEGGEGEPCDSVRACRVGLACFRVGDRDLCARPCCEDGACGFGARCVAGARLASGVETAWGRCTASGGCDVLQPERSCPRGEACYIVGPDGATACRPAGRAGPGDPCSQPEDCRPGFYCGGALGAGHCVRVCALDGAGPGCPSEEGSCVRAGASPEGTGLCVFAGGRRAGGP